MHDDHITTGCHRKKNTISGNLLKKAAEGACEFNMTSQDKEK